MLRTWVVAPVAAVTVLAVQFAAPVPGTGIPVGSAPVDSARVEAAAMDAAMDAALAAAEQAANWRCDLPHRTAAQRTAAQRTLRATSPAPTFIERAEPAADAADPAPQPIAGFGTEPGQNPRVKVNGSLAGADSVDVYQVPLRAGEVFSATVRGSGGTLEVRDPKGVLVEGSGIDRSGIYPPASPLLGGGNATVDHVASVAGPHTITVRPAEPRTEPVEGADPTAESTPEPGSTPEAGGAPQVAASEQVTTPVQTPALGSAAAPSTAAVDAATTTGPAVVPPAPLDLPADDTMPGAGSSVASPSSTVPTPGPNVSAGPATAAQPSGGVPTAVPPSEIPSPSGTPAATDPKAYQVDLGIFRPGSNSGQKIVLEFSGGTVDTRTFGVETAHNMVKLGPVSTFLGRLGLSADDQPALIAKITDTVRENMSGTLDGGRVDVISADRPGVFRFGEPGVTRVLIGGSTAELGIPTVAIAESVDPGNFAREETAVVLMDRVSGPPRQLNGDPNPASFALYLPAQVDKKTRIDFVGQAIGNLASHEIGHMLGSWHTDRRSGKHDLMSPGDVVAAYGLGLDRKALTLDDVRGRFGSDVFDPEEGLYGEENTRYRTAIGLGTTPHSVAE